jgi:hypothetical protein
MEAIKCSLRGRLSPATLRSEQKTVIIMAERVECSRCPLPYTAVHEEANIMERASCIAYQNLEEPPLYTPHGSHSPYKSSIDRLCITFVSESPRTDGRIKPSVQRAEPHSSPKATTRLAHSRNQDVKYGTPHTFSDEAGLSPRSSPCFCAPAWPTQTKLRNLRAGTLASNISSISSRVRPLVSGRKK